MAVSFGIAGAANTVMFGGSSVDIAVAVADWLVIAAPLTARVNQVSVTA
jgi:hypothetical protein